MKIDKSKFDELLVDREGRKIDRNLKLDALKESGVAFANFGLNVGDVIEFPDNEDELSINSMPVRKFGTVKQYVIGVLRNGKESLLSLGSLRQRDKDNKAYGSVAQEMVDNTRFGDDKDRVKYLFGKKLKCIRMEPHQVGVWDEENNRVSTTEFVERNFAVCEYITD